MTNMETELKSLQARVQKIEELLFNQPKIKIARKSMTLAEIARKKTLKDANGQEKVAAIIGFYEIIAGEGPSKPEKIKSGWKTGKFVGKFNPAFVSRATGALIRNLEDGTYDLTQKGEEEFEKWVKE